MPDTMIMKWEGVSKARYDEIRRHLRQVPGEPPRPAVQKAAITTAPEVKFLATHNIFTPGYTRK